MHSRRAIVGGALLLLIAMLALLAPVVAPADPLRQDLPHQLERPSRAHPLGTDRLGRDVLARLLYGARLSLAVGTAAIAGALAVGVVAGTLAGYGGRVGDELLMRATDVLLAFPGILLAIALAAVLGPSARNVVIALTVMGWPAYARLVRAEIRAAAARESTRAAEALGATPLRIAVKHLLPSARPAIVVQATFGVAGAIVAEASLSFLGLGPPPPTPSWGAMLAEGRSFLLIAPHLVIAPAAALGLTVLAIQLLGDGLRGDRADTTS
ncbi:ABC transporter permease [Candidatus Binatia bacterium]|jgi:peptide/nickel transport system permease protein|nr:ABC transporter permease [Candidatus Binatia bacterium]